MTTSDWRQGILEHFSPEHAAVTRLTVVTDPDELLLEQGVLDRLRVAGFDLVPFDDPVAFRYHYESQYRQRWDRGETTNLVVVLRTPQATEDALPFDLLQEARRQHRVLRFSVARVFEHLVPSVVRALDRRFFDRLWAAYTEQSPKAAGERATKDFILRWVFSVTAEQLQTPTQLLRSLLARHYSGEMPPAPIDAYLLERLRQSPRWNEWPLEAILSDRGAFFAFLQERWPYFLRRKARHGSVGVVASPESAYGLRFPGVVELPFDADEVHVYIDNLFAEGHLQPVTAPPDTPDGWWRVGIVHASPEQLAAERFTKLTELLSPSPGVDADRNVWMTFASRFAEWTMLRWSTGTPVAVHSELHHAVESGFRAWMDAHYAALANLPYLPHPTMVHHVAPFLRASRKGAARCALVVVDGLAMDQWVVLRNAIQRPGGTGFLFDERSLFAWVPTLTSVSRQALFAGQVPQFFAASIDTTYREKDHWQRAWADAGLLPAAVGHVVHGDEGWHDFAARVRTEAERPACKALGVVVNTVDRLMHASQHGIAGMHAAVRHWATTGELQGLLDGLLGAGFDVWLTADHGNVESVGVGRPNLGLGPDASGQRVFRFSTPQQRDGLLAEYPGSTAWPGIGLPADSFVALAPDAGAFWTDGARLVAHGGVSLEEVIVPFVRIRSAS